jgi:hypothetical protein
MKIGLGVSASYPIFELNAAKKKTLIRASNYENFHGRGKIKGQRKKGDVFHLPP